jgi:RNA polymerase sigma factor (sigma-70 family)
MISEIERKEAFEIINSVLLSIPQKEMEILIMREADGVKLKEISNLFKLSIGQVRQVSLRAARKLRHPTRLYKLQEAAEVIFS